MNDETIVTDSAPNASKSSPIEGELLAWRAFGPADRDCPVCWPKTVTPETAAETARYGYGVVGAP